MLAVVPYLTLTYLLDVLLHGMKGVCGEMLKSMQVGVDDLDFDVNSARGHSNGRAWATRVHHVSPTRFGRHLPQTLHFHPHVHDECLDEVPCRVNVHHLG